MAQISEQPEFMGFFNGHSDFRAEVGYGRLHIFNRTSVYNPGLRYWLHGF